jgi:hypothetical protein
VCSRTQKTRSMSQMRCNSRRTSSAAPVFAIERRLRTVTMPPRPAGQGSARTKRFPTWLRRTAGCAVMTVAVTGRTRYPDGSRRNAASRRSRRACGR